jgi:uncharacterized membrane protein
MTTRWRRLTPEKAFVLLILLATAALLLLPTGFPTSEYADSQRAKVRILAVDNSGVEQQARFVLQGAQICSVQVESGQFKGTQATSVNHFIGKLEVDKIFQSGDYALAVLDIHDGRVVAVTLIDHYRLNLEGILFLAFTVLLVAFAGWTGLKALLSFVFSVLMIWKVLTPAFLQGYNPVLVSLLVVTVLTVIIITLVTGFSRRSLVAISGAFAGTALTCVLALVCGEAFRIHGTILPWAESLLYNGYAHLQLTDIFIASIFLASAGALMDLAMDIAAATHELIDQNPGLSRRELIRSGLSIGRAVIGTMTTTLLLAYSGGYIALLMVFMAQGTPVANILNLRYVSAEILHTLVGSFGLVTVAPLTAIIAGLVYVRKPQPQAKGLPDDSTEQAAV